jgi:hypothetical protein
VTADAALLTCPRGLLTSHPKGLHFAWGNKGRSGSTISHLCANVASPKQCYSLGRSQMANLRAVPRMRELIADCGVPGLAQNWGLRLPGCTYLCVLYIGYLGWHLCQGISTCEASSRLELLHPSEIGNHLATLFFYAAELCSAVSYHDVSSQGVHR